MTNTMNQDQAPKDHLRDIRDTAKTAATDAAQAQANAAQSHAAAKVDQTADALDAAAQTFDPNSLQAEAARQVADRLEALSSQIRTTDLSGTVNAVSDFARRNPAVFIGGAALLGFAATRFLKASAPVARTYVEDDDDPWASPSATAVPHPDLDTLASMPGDTDHHARVTKLGEEVRNGRS